MTLNKFTRALRELCSDIEEDQEFDGIDVDIYLNDDDLERFIAELKSYPFNENITKVHLTLINWNVYRLRCYINSEVWKDIHENLFSPQAVLKVDTDIENHRKIHSGLVKLCNLNHWSSDILKCVKILQNDTIITTTHIPEDISEDTHIDVHYIFEQISSQHLNDILNTLELIMCMEHVIVTDNYIGARTIAFIHPTVIDSSKVDDICYIGSNKYDESTLNSMIHQLPTYSVIKTKNVPLIYELILNAQGIIGSIFDDHIYYSLPTDISIFNNQIWGAIDISDLKHKRAFIRSYRKYGFSKPYRYIDPLVYVPLYTYDEWLLFRSIYTDMLHMGTEDPYMFLTNDVVFARKIMLRYPGADVLVAPDYYLFITDEAVNTDNVDLEDKTDLILGLNLKDDYDMIMCDTINNASIEDIALGVNIGGFFFRHKEALKIFRDPITRQSISRDTYIHISTTPFNHFNTGLVWRHITHMNIPYKLKLDSYFSSEYVRVEITMLSTSIYFRMPTFIFESGLFRKLFRTGYVFPESTMIFLNRNSIIANTQMDVHFRQLIEDESNLDYLKWLIE
jgi:hypothetical protein